MDINERKAAEVEQIRQTSLIETENISKKNRFGLFSKPPGLCIHDPYTDKPHSFRGATSSQKDLSKPKNVSTMKPKKGKNEDIYFSVPSYVTIGDTYQDPHKLKKYNYFNGNAQRPKTITAWRTTDVQKTQVAPPYPYIEDTTKSDAALPIFIPPEEKDKEISNQRFSSSVGKRGRNFNRFTDYMSDPYDTAREKQRRERINHRNKLMHGPFLNSDKFSRPFTSNCELHDKRNFENGKPEFIQADLDTLAGGLARKTDKIWRPSNPAKKGYNGPLNK